MQFKNQEQMIHDRLLRTTGFHRVPEQEIDACIQDVNDSYNNPTGVYEARKLPAMNSFEEFYILQQ